MLRRKKGPAGEPPWASLVAGAKRLYDETGNEAYDQFADLVLAHATEGTPAELVGQVPKVAPTVESARVAQRDPTTDEDAAARTVALVAAFAFSQLDAESAGQLTTFAALHAVRFPEYQAAAGRR